MDEQSSLRLSIKRIHWAQAQFKAEIEKSGGANLVVRSFDDFLQQYNSTFQQMTPRCPKLNPNTDHYKLKYGMDGEKDQGNPALINKNQSQ